MDPIQANFVLVKIEEDQWDVLIFSEDAVLKSFTKTYKNLFFIPKHKSVFKSDMVVVPDFPNQTNAQVWKEYWELAFKDPDNSCHSCPTVKELFENIKVNRECGKH